MVMIMVSVLQILDQYFIFHQFMTTATVISHLRALIRYEFIQPSREVAVIRPSIFLLIIDIVQ